MQYANCTDLLNTFMSITLPDLWRNEPDQMRIQGLIQGWNKDSETVAPFDRFAKWESDMCNICPDLMRKTRSRLLYFKGVAPIVVSPNGTNWAFLVAVIKYMFLQLVSGDKKEDFENRRNYIK